MADQSEDTAGVIAPPPVIFAASVAVGFLLQKARPLPVVPPALGRPLGTILALAGLGLGASAFNAMKQAGTNVDPYEPTTAIVEQGPYRSTRNPIYLGMVLLGSGIGLFANAGWVLAALPVAIGITQKGVIEREETYLAQRFPEAYPAYAERVRRWF